MHSGRPEHPPDPLEPLRLGQHGAQMGLEHVVVTSVDRDDLPDSGAGHFAATIRALKAKVPARTVEVSHLISWASRRMRSASCSRSKTEVFNHNIETVRRLHRRMRGAKACYDKALWLLERAKEVADYPVLTKSGIIVGLGETNDEVVDTMRDLRAHGVDVVTIGQYLQPSAKHVTIDRWVHPEEFRWFREQGEALGFGSVFSGPLVRSSYRAPTSNATRLRRAAAQSRTRRRTSGGTPCDERLRSAVHSLTDGSAGPSRRPPCHPGAGAARRERRLGTRSHADRSGNARDRSDLALAVAGHGSAERAHTRFGRPSEQVRHRRRAREFRGRFPGREHL